MNEYQSEREKVLEAEVTTLRERLENVRYEMNIKLEDRIEELERDSRTLETIAKTRLENVKPGDVFLIESQEVVNTLNIDLLVKMSREYGCNFVASNGMDQIKKMTDLELEKLNLRKLVAGERPTGADKLDSILIDIKKTRELKSWTPDEGNILSQMGSAVEAARGAFTMFEHELKTKHSELRGM